MERLRLVFLSIFFIFIFISNCYADRLKRPPLFQQLTMKEGLSSDMVYSIAIKGDEIWFGTYGGGATLFDRSNKRLKFYTTKGEPMEKVDDGVSIRWKNLLSYNHVSVILTDEDRIWFGTYFYGFGGGGISYYNPKRNPQWKLFNTNNDRAKKVVSMALDEKWLWVGSEKGLNLLDKKIEDWKAFYSTRDGLSGNFINTILLQPNLLWVGTNGGISRFEIKKNSWKNYPLLGGLPEVEIKSLARVGRSIWAGGINGFLFEYDSDSDNWKKIESTDALKNGGINFIIATKDKVFVCRDNGVSIYDIKTNHWESLTSSDGLLSNMVFCAAEDKESIWFGTDKGASRLVLTP